MAAKIRGIKAASVTIKLDIGANKPGGSGKTLEDFLITLLSALGPEEEQEIILSEMRIVHADILIGNEVDNSSIRIFDTDTLVAPHAGDAVRSFGTYEAIGCLNSG